MRYNLRISSLNWAENYGYSPSLGKAMFFWKIESAHVNRNMIKEHFNRTYVTVRTDKPKRVQSYVLLSLFNQATYTYSVSDQ